LLVSKSLLSGAKTEIAAKNHGLIVVGLQLLLIIISAGVTYLTDNPQSGISIIWGELCALVNASLLSWRMMQREHQDATAGRQLVWMYRSALERFFVVIGLLAFGMLRLHLPAGQVILGFVMGQAALLLVPLVRGILNRSRVEVK
jgi:F0F1-type ATP synthase assembly protein I